jgi:hypothetical protein
MVRHRTEVPALDVVLVENVAQNKEELPIVIFVEEDLHLAVAARDDVPNQTGIAESFGSGHAIRYSRFDPRGNTPKITGKHDVRSKSTRWPQRRESAQIAVVANRHLSLAL